MGLSLPRAALSSPVAEGLSVTPIAPLGGGAGTTATAVEAAAAVPSWMMTQRAAYLESATPSGRDLGLGVTMRCSPQPPCLRSPLLNRSHRS
jgi:hypothetical protein